MPSTPMKLKYSILPVLFYTVFGYGQQSFPIDSLFALVEKNYPSIRQQTLNLEGGALVQKALTTNWYPKVNVGGSATYQNEVTEFSIPGAGASAFPNTKKDQYKIGLELSQTLFDAGLTKAQMEIEELNTISRENSLKLFIALGFFILFGFVSFMFFQSPDSTMKSTFLPLLIRGVGLGMLITPIITLSIDCLLY